MIYKWGDLISLEYGKPVADKNSIDGPVPVFGTNGQIGTSHLPPLCKESSFILGRKGAYRGVKYSDIPFSVIDTAFYAMNQRPDILLIKWAYYKFLTYDINSMDSGSAIPSTDRYEIYGIEVDLPDYETQKRIVSILDSLDDKIELNNRINENIEQQVFSMFHNWIMSINKGKMRKVPLAQVTSAIIRGITTKYIDKSELLNLNQKVNKGSILEKQYYKYLDPSISVPQEKYAHKKDILLNSLGQGTLGRIHYYNEETDNVIVDQHITIIRALDKVTTPEFLYLSLSSEEGKQYFESCVTGTTGMQMLNISAVRKYEINLPEYGLQKEFSEVVLPMFEMKTELEQQNEQLSQLRTFLLPKLMSGELDISEIDL